MASSHTKLLLALSGADPTSSAASCHLQPLAGAAADPYLFGLNTVLGPIVNLSYSDRGLLAATEALGVGSLRYPGGTVANYWDMRAGRYVGDGGSDCRNGTHWNYCSWQERIDAHPALTFSPANFWRGVASASAGAASGGPIWDLNLFSLPLKDQLAQVDALKSAGVPVTHIELGNEFDHSKNYAWKFKNADDYMEAAKPIIAKVRQVFPDAIIAVVLKNGPGGWNTAMAKHAGLFDAVTIHKYSPGANDLTGYDAASLPSLIAGWGDVVSTQISDYLRTDFKGKAVWRTEFNYPTWNGGYPLPELANGALHGIYWASNVLAGVQRYNWNVPFRAVMLHAFAAQDGTKWDSSAGLVQVSNNADDVERVRINGVGQIFAHMSRAALQLAGGQMHPVSTPADDATCGAMSIAIDGVSGLGCLQAAAFSPASKQHAAVYVVLNKCGARTVTLDLSALGAQAGGTFTATSYEATDAGGWAPLPADASELPWGSGPLSPTLVTTTPQNLAEVSVVLPEVSLTIAVFAASSASEALV